MIWKWVKVLKFKTSNEKGDNKEKIFNKLILNPCLKFGRQVPYLISIHPVEFSTLDSEINVYQFLGYCSGRSWLHCGLLGFTVKTSVYKLGWSNCSINWNQALRFAIAITWITSHGLWIKFCCCFFSHPLRFIFTRETDIKMI